LQKERHCLDALGNVLNRVVRMEPSRIPGNPARLQINSE
jgi:hypothetical protein